MVRDDGVRPYRKGGYEPRRRIHLRINEKKVEVIDDLAAKLILSRAYFVELVLDIAIEQGDWLKKAIAKRVEDRLAAYRARWQ